MLKNQFVKGNRKNDQLNFKNKSKPDDILKSNITSAKGLIDSIRTSLGQGMDKMIIGGDKSSIVIITNDGATILKKIKVLHPASKILVNLSESQDAEAGDGTTSVVVLAGSLLGECESLLAMGMHPLAIAEGFRNACKCAIGAIESMSKPVELSDRESLIKSAHTSLHSKVVSNYSNVLAPLCVDAVLKIIDIEKDTTVNLKDIQIIKKMGPTVDESVLVPGLVLDNKCINQPNGIRRVEKAKIAVVQFCLSPPKTNIDSQVMIDDYTQMDKILQEEREYILKIVKKIKKSGCNVLLIQKSILRDALNELAEHYLTKLKIMVVKDVERTHVEFICKSLNCRPVASLDRFEADALAHVDLVYEQSISGSKVIMFEGMKQVSKTMSIILKGSNEMILEEAERSVHDALCVVTCLVKKRSLITGAGAPEIEASAQLLRMSNKCIGNDQYCFRAFSKALDIIPFTLAENSGINAMETVAKLKSKHNEGFKDYGINMATGQVCDMWKESVVQPLLVSTSAFNLATEAVCCILKIDEIITIPA
ncbi:CCT-delta [Intoshia linei]|uniref:T-complex protein 1 subunit delta n=1 Tax=Intoshia linei TaxID=1819745 RepID=A0A177B8Y3_9BILA|nr:CCT-delta [Intoshia linei]